jgi:ubiquinone/menaquinone biosynthesis C-methylase UbiE
MNPPEGPKTEPGAVEQRYARRDRKRDAWLYDPLNPSIYMAVQERQRELIQLVAAARLAPLAGRTVFEVGCGSGGNLLELIQLGFKPSNLVGNELLPERLAAARSRLPDSVRLMAGDANQLDLQGETFDIVLQSTVFTSILSKEFQRSLSRRMWSWVKPGGGVVWYDFAFNNPKNPDVMGVRVSQIREMFPEGSLRVRRVTLAPPISRLVTRLHPSMYSLFNAIGPFRTHLLCWIAKR